MNRMTDDSLNALYFELPIMHGEQPATCQRLGISRSALQCRLKRLEAERLVVNIGTGWVKTSDEWIEEATNG